MTLKDRWRRLRRRYRKLHPAKRGRAWLLLWAAVLAVVVGLGLQAARRWQPRGADPDAEQVATLDGQAITLADLRAEQAATGLALPDTIAGRRPLLERIVARRLLAAEAARRGLDAAPAVRAELARADEQLLAQVTLSRAAAAAGAVDDAAARRFIAAHPAMFARRETIALDQLVVASAPARAVLATADSFDEVASRLARQRIAVVRTRRTLDSAAMPPEFLRQLATLKPGEPFAVVEGDRTIVSRIRRRAPVTLAAADALTAARAAAQQEQVADANRALTARLRGEARIVEVGAAR